MNDERKQIFRLGFCIAVIILWPVVSNAVSLSPSPAQARLCSIIKEAESKYTSLKDKRSTARSENNGIVEQRLTTEMTSVYSARNAEIFEFAKQTDFSFKDWLVIVRRIGSPSKSTVLVDFRLVCSRGTPPTWISSYIPISHAIVEFLSKAKDGDYLLVSGVFWGKGGSANELEKSLTESGSMYEPEYRADITLLKRITPLEEEVAPRAF